MTEMEIAKLIWTIGGAAIALVVGTLTLLVPNIIKLTKSIVGLTETVNNIKSKYDEKTKNLDNRMNFVEHKIADHDITLTEHKKDIENLKKSN